VAQEVEQFGIKVRAVGLGQFRADFLDSSSMQWVDDSIADYEDLSKAILGRYEKRNHNQPGDPAKLAPLILEFSRRENRRCARSWARMPTSGAKKPTPSGPQSSRPTQARSRSTDLDPTVS
jgi:hypothetical protein